MIFWFSVPGFHLFAQLCSLALNEDGRNAVALRIEVFGRTLIDTRLFVGHQLIALAKPLSIRTLWSKP